MRRILTGRLRRSVIATLFVLMVAILAWGPVAARDAGLWALLVGGGPELQHNQVAIERNVAYLSRLLPPGTPRIVLYADGDAKHKTVLYEEAPQNLPPAEELYAMLFESPDGDTPTEQRFRAPNLGKLDGPSRRAPITDAFARLRRQHPGRALLYFTGHGSQARDHNLDNNAYDLWSGERLSVHDLASEIATLPSDVPVTLVMVECFSGSFGNLLFEGGDPGKPLVDREIAGFFAAPRERMAAGCTPEVNEAEYHDFTSYFFAALTGHDRVGRTVTGADYNHDGQVGMDEAFAYSLIHDISIDVPVCTSDVFLRKFVPGDDAEIFRTDYSQARSWATPAQGAALDELSRALNLTSEGRLGEAYRMGPGGQGRGMFGGSRQAMRRFMEARRDIRTSLLDRWPELRRKDGPGYANARAQAVAELGRRLQDGRLKEFTTAREALDQAEEASLQQEVSQARLLRFVRLAKSVILAHRLRESDDLTNRQRFERLAAAEQRPFLSPAAVAER